MTREKKQMKRRLIIALLLPVFLLIGFLVISTFTGDIAWNSTGLFFKEIEGGYSVEDSDMFFIWFAKTAQIPETYKGKPVIRIGSYAFDNCYSLTSVTIPNSVTSIGKNAFSGCSSLASVTIPDSVTSIGSGAFYRCSSLASVTIPDSITSIGSGAFSRCTNLIQIEDGVSYVDKWIIDCDRSVATPTLRSDTVGIADRAFFDCNKLTSITIPEGVTNIGDSAFYNCIRLTSATLLEGVTSIGDSAFSCCGSLIGVAIPNSISSIGKNAFYYCDELSIVIFNGTIEQWISIKKGENWDYGTYYYEIYYTDNEVSPPENNSPADDTPPAGDNPIDEDATQGLAYTLIQDGTAYAVSGIGTATGSSIIIPSTYEGLPVVAIGNNAFYNCINLKSVSIPDSVTSIGDSAFDGCYELVSITIPGSVSTIGNMAFYDCASLTSVTIEAGVNTIGEMAFSGCLSLTSITIPGSIEIMKEGAFSYCTNLKTVILEDGVVCIGALAFSSCEKLTSVTIPTSVTKISGFAFDACNKLTSLNYLGTKAQWNSISKDEYWNFADFAFDSRTVYCTDGEILEATT